MPHNNKRLMHFGYTHDETEQSVRALFAARFGVNVVAVFHASNGDWWAGPVVEEAHPETMSAEIMQPAESDIHS